MTDFTQAWITRLQQVTASTVVSPDAGFLTFAPISLDSGVRTLRRVAQRRAADHGRIVLFGNGGSLAIASHIATDFSLAGWPSIALTDAVALTSHTNDFGPEENLTKQIELLRPSPHDTFIALSCSGKSPNILDAVRAARAVFGSYIVTLSGFDSDNPLRRLGQLNFYVPAHEYGFVQLAHESVLHAACDIENGWHP